MVVHPTFSTIMIQIANSSNGLAEEPLGRAFELTNISISIFVLLFGVIENTCVLFILGSRWSQLKSFEVHIISLAIADLIESILFPLKELFIHLGGSYLYLGVASCKLVSFLCSISISVSALTLIAISIDRYSGIKWPLRRYFTKRKSLCIASSIWMFSTSIATIYLIDGRVVLCRYRDVYLCGIQYLDVNEEQILVVTFFVIQGGIPLLSLIVIYSLIVRDLSHETKKSTLFQYNEKERRTRFIQNRRTTKLVFGIVIVFIICVIPDRIFFLFFIYNNRLMSSATFKRIHIILLMLFMANGCVNPIIYSRIHSLLRRQLLGSIKKIRTIRCEWLRKRFCRDKATKTDDVVEADEFLLMYRRCSQLRYTYFDDAVIQGRRHALRLNEDVQEISHYTNTEIPAEIPAEI